MRRHVLVLGGTAEAYDLALAIDALPGWRVTTSLAGRTAAPRLPAGDVRVGGFGGIEGLAAWCGVERVAAVIDATHPYAQQIHANARDAALLAGVPLLRLERPAWTPGPGDDWHAVEDVPTALDRLRMLGAVRVLAVVGRREVAALAGLPAVAFFVRSVEPPEVLPSNARWLQGRGPFALEDETGLMRREAIDAVLCRASGGEGGRAKLDAARTLGLPVVMLRRPKGTGVADVAGAIAWLERCENASRPSL